MDEGYVRAEDGNMDFSDRGALISLHQMISINNICKYGGDDGISAALGAAKGELDGLLWLLLASAGNWMDQMRKPFSKIMCVTRCLGYILIAQ